MTWMLTWTGEELSLDFIAQDSINLLDIAHALALINRFGGHTSRPYCVAEHSLLVCSIMEECLGVVDPTYLLCGLMHDAHEAYCGDMTQPMKQVLGDPWARVEQRLEHAVLSRFGLLTPSIELRAVIKLADRMALAIERPALLPASPTPWECLMGLPNLPRVNLADRAVFTPADWRQAFLDRFAELTYGRDVEAQPAVASGNSPPLADTLA